MSYLLIKFVHLTAAAFFIGGVFFELFILRRASAALPVPARDMLGKAIGARARKVMHWVVLALYGAGFWLAWQYRDVLAQPFSSSFSTLLMLKITLALIILGQFIAVVILMKTGRITAGRSRFIHCSVFVHMLGILFLAKAMSYAW